MSRGLGYIFYSIPGLGKTSFSLQMPKPLQLYNIGETGYEDLQVLGQVPEGCSYMNPSSYEELFRHIQVTKAKTYVIDALLGFQQLFFEYITRTMYSNDAKKFSAFYTGPRIDAVGAIPPFLALLSAKLAQGSHVVLIAHQTVETEENATGVDFAKSEIHMDKGIRQCFYKWAPNIFFGNLETLIRDGKADSSGSRILYTSLSNQHCSKNKLGMPAFIPLGNSPQEGFKNFWDKVPEVYKQ